ncbi:uncharacterized mitochondrial protein AtMg00810-like [Nicotiana sylvestris]|uniref:uncharacterized mitochondrial protein AtMg00810-like n=1 Tax=Nicotiana sylvestris TaxID=4096 RepID=UPI00388C800F
MSNYLSYDSLSPSYAKSLSAHSSIVEPKHYHEASKDARWIIAMQQEVTALEENNTWDVVDLSVEFDEAVLCSDDGTCARVKDCVLLDPEPYQRLVGRLLYPTMTRPDITYVVQVLSQFMHKPKRSHMDTALRLIKYVKNAPGLGLLLSSQQSGNLVAFCDSDWAFCPQSRKSVTRYIVKFRNSLIS